MNNFLYFSLCALVAATVGGCAGKSYQTAASNTTDPPEMHIWNPPTEDELESRRAMQIYLDGIERDIEKLFLSHEETLLLEENLRAGVLATPSRIDRIESNLSPRIEDESTRHEKMESELASVKSSLDTTRAELEKTRQSMIVIPFSEKDYIGAIRLFRDGHYKKSAELFKTSLSQKPPRSIIDNIYFGLGASYYKMKKDSQAIAQFNQVLENYQDGDKWYISSLMLGFIHNRNSDKSKAIYVLHQALKKNPPESVRVLIDRLLHLIEEGTYG